VIHSHEANNTVGGWALPLLMIKIVHREKARCLRSE